MAPLVSVQEVSRDFGTRMLFNELSFAIEEGQKVGLIGPNGAGKSTLLKMIAGLEEPDHGSVLRRRDLRMEYVPQSETFDPSLTVEETLLRAGRADERDLFINVAMAIGQAEFPSPHAKVGDLSGGWRKRLSIVRALLHEPQLVLFDEPTNHLDLAGILWLEELCQNASFSYIAISHDRYFLENTVSSIIEINRRYPRGFFSSNGGYSDFLLRRDEYVANLEAQELSLANKVRREVEWLRRGAKARTTKAVGRINSATSMIESLKESKSRSRISNEVTISFGDSGRETKKLLEAHKLTKALGGRTLFRGLSFLLRPGVRIGLLGNNGSGKSTLLKILEGKLEPDSGRVERARDLAVTIFEQDRSSLDLSVKLREALSPHSDSVVFDGRSIHIITWARKFLFRPDQLEVRVGELSGGEQARVLIARLMLSSSDVLFLDEPTNDLDLSTLEILEEALLQYKGAVVLVSHDRALLDRVCTHFLGFDGQGGMEAFASVTQWQEYLALLDKGEISPKAEQEEPAAPKPRKKLGYIEQRELDGMEKAIAAGEKKVQELTELLQDPSNASDAKKLHELSKELGVAQAAVDKLFERWAELEKKT